ncbi:MAG TPA: carbonic anhydrase [Ktedonobacterales bacterium]
MASGTFGTAINCIDGRAQRPVADWVLMNCHVDYVDMVTVPGADHVLGAGPADRIERLREDVTLSVQAHHSQVIAIAGHHGCAAFDVAREEHLAAIRAAARVVRGWGLPARVVGLWVNDWWAAELVYDAADEPNS